MVLLEGLKLSLRVGAGKRNVLVGGIERFGKVHLQTFWSGDNNMGTAVVTEKLGKTETSRTGAEHEDGGAELRGNLFEAVAGAGSGLEEGSINVGEVVDLEDLASGIGAVFGESTIH